MRRPRPSDPGLRPSGRLLPAAALALLLLLSSLLAACGEEDNGGNGSGDQPTPTATTPPPTPTTPAPPSPTTTPDAIAHPTGANDIVLLVEVTGGFVPPHLLITNLPTFALLGDGSVVTQGPVIAIYPAPALPNLRVTKLTEEGVQYILREAKAAGLLDGNAEYGFGGIADAPTTYFTTNAGGTISYVSAYALGMDGVDPAPTPGVAEAREKLVAFQAKLSDLTTWIPANDIVSTGEEYEITRMQVVSQAADSSFAPSDPSITPQIKDWPLTTPLAELGEPFYLDQSRCVVLEGADLTTLLDALKDANQITRWTSGAEQYVLYLRPLIGSQPGCVMPTS